MRMRSFGGASFRPSLSYFAMLTSFMLIVLLTSAFEVEGRKLTYRKHNHRHHHRNLGLSAEWHAWKSVHSKIYRSPREELERHVLWQSNKKFIEAHNIYNETFGYTLAMNEFGDLVSWSV